MLVGAIVQARVGSIRLPGKVLQPFPQGSILELILQKLLWWSSLNRGRSVSVATTRAPADGAIEELAETLLVEVVKGDESDVLGRVARAAEACRCDVVVRVTADNPFLDIGLLERTLNLFFSEAADYAFVTGAPIGVAAEVISASSLRTAAREASGDYDREHVTPYIRRKGKFRHAWLNLEPDLSCYNLSVDTKKQFERAFRVALGLSGRVLTASFGEVIDYITENGLVLPGEPRTLKLGDAAQWPAKC